LVSEVPDHSFARKRHGNSALRPSLTALVHAYKIC